MTENHGSRAPAHWKRIALSDLVDILDSRRVPVNAKERESRQGNVPYYGATGQVGWIDDHLFDEELVLLGEDGAPFFDSTRQKAFIVRGRSWVNNHAHVLRPRNGMPSAFLKHQLDQVDYREFVSGTTRAKLPQGPMRRIGLLVPPIAEQEQIVAALESHFSRLDAATATLERVQRNLDRYRASVLKAAVEGRLVPTEAELAKKESRSYEPASVLLKRILAERRRRWEEAELARLTAKGKAPSDDRWKAKYVEPAASDMSGRPELPEGWCWASVEQMGETVTGTTPPTNDPSYYGGDIPFVKPTDLDAGYHVIASRQSLSHRGIERARVLPEGSVLVTCIGATIGKTGLARVRCATNQQINALVPPEELRASRYLYWYFCSPAGQADVVGNASATTLPILNKGKFERLSIPLPPAGEQYRIVEGIERLLSVNAVLADSMRVGRTRVNRLRQSILKCAFEGRLVDQHESSAATPRPGLAHV